MRAIVVAVLAGAAVSGGLACPCGGGGMYESPFCAGLDVVTSGTLADWQSPRSVEGVSGYNNECRPSLTADGRILCFHADAINGPPYDPHHIGTETHVYTAKWTGARWDSVEMLDSVAGAFGRYPFISADGSKILFQRGVDNQDLYITRWTGTNWDTARSLGSSINTPDRDECYPFLSPDTHLLYFASNRDSCIGRRDLWVCRWHGDSVDSITNLGPGVNKSGATNWNPYVTPDGNQLYFSREQRSLFGPQELWVSTWTGTEWGEAENAGAPLNGPMHICSSFLLAAQNRLFLGGDVSEGGFGAQDLWVSRPAASAAPAAGRGQSQTGWTNTAELDSAWFVHCLIQTHDHAIYAGTGPYGRVFRTTDLGASWQKTAVLPGALKVYALLEASDSAIYAGTYPNGDVFKTADQGASWTNTANIPKATTVSALLETEDSTIYAAVFPSDDGDIGHVLKTTNRGGSWLPTADLPNAVGGVLSLTPAFNNTLLAGCYAGASLVHRSTDAGATWDTVRLPIPPANRDEWTRLSGFLTVSPCTLYAAGWVHGYGGMVWLSTDNGLSWDSVPTRIHTGPVQSHRIETLLRLDDGSMLAGFQPARDSGVFRTTDRGATWINTGFMPDVREVLCLLRLDDGTIFAGTTANGDVFKYESGAIHETAPDAPGSLALEASPSPFAGETHISYGLPRPGNARLAVYDAAGNLVAPLVDGFVPAGRHTATWSGCSVRGVYFCALEGAGGRAKIKLVHSRD